MGRHCPNCGHKIDPDAVLSWGGWTLDEDTRRLELATGEVYYLPGSIMVMAVGALVRAAGRLVTRNGVYGAMYALRPEVDQPELKSVDVCIHKFKKLSPTIYENLETVWGRGYYLKEIKGADNQGVRDLEAEAREASS